MAEITTAGQRRGLLVIPWFEFGLMAPSDSVLARRYRHWLSQTRGGTLTSPA